MKKTSELKPEDKPAEHSQGSRKILTWLIATLVGWALLVSLGTLVSSEKFDLRKPLIVLGVMASFLGIWWIAFSAKKKRNLGS